MSKHNLEAAFLLLLPIQTTPDRVQIHLTATGEDTGTHMQKGSLLWLTGTGTQAKADSGGDKSRVDNEPVYYAHHPYRMRDSRETQNAGPYKRQINDLPDQYQRYSPTRRLPKSNLVKVSGSLNLVSDGHLNIPWSQNTSTIWKSDAVIDSSSSAIGPH
jgi:hypothetical protein